MNLFAPRTAAMLALPLTLALGTPAATASNNESAWLDDLAQRAAQTRLGEVRRPAPAQTPDGPLGECQVSLAQSQQAVASLEDYLAAKPEDAQISDDYLLQFIRQQLSC